jgi:hypothetical protein
MIFRFAPNNASLGMTESLARERAWAGEGTRPYVGCREVNEQLIH